MDYEEIKLVIIWEKHCRNRELNFDKKEKYALELTEIFNKLLENQMIDKLIEKSIRKYRSSWDPIIDGLKLAKLYIEKHKIYYSKKNLDEVNQAIKQINKVRERIIGIS
ncbi:hypothetical protein [Acinetobacter pollinis]|uniref:Uncharacterized protein n=1 Tax=Acinetobacter pollinis TaxID=2605270 RepID=A0ABU6DW68_9GAMM|nr:hypothetical protein [Acinetobacter pollinis]MEB5477932.1 hypothetical protein [Acinetobacter pollinis]